ncbi:sensor histidine kinase [Desulfopila sp. IMCC35008]|uniref:sensor histidine kinase n=1 Tax=Desulfopila sp. IMCC35008 TaxID=2653858 RepID=UPI0013D8AAD0|nr:sensor histidine kinase [Desulfopila sp. IMCC35008]
MEGAKISNSMSHPMPRQVSSLNTAWLIQCVRSRFPEVDLGKIVLTAYSRGPFYIENLSSGKIEPVDVRHLESPDYWFSNLYMISLYDAITEFVPDPDFAYNCGRTFYQSQSLLKTAVGVPLIGPYRLIRRIVSENDKYNRTKQAVIRKLEKGHVVLRLIHIPNVIMNDFGMQWHLGAFESYARLAGVTDVQGTVSCIEKGPARYGEPGRAIYDFSFTFKDPGFISRIANRLIYAIPAVKKLIHNAELVQSEHNEQIVNRDRIIREKTEKLVSIQAKLMEAERQTIEQRLQHLSTELITTEERERRSIAEDLHDSVTQLLALSVSGLRKRNRLQSGDGELQRIQQYLQKALGETRSLTFQISPPVLYDFGLEAAVEWLVNDISARNTMEIDYINLLDQPLVLSDHRKITLYRAVREALINCIKHAEADYGSVVLNYEDGRSRIEIEDNGVGFDPDTMQKGFGLSSLADRLGSIDASLELHSAPGNGSRIVILLPQ